MLEEMLPVDLDTTAWLVLAAVSFIASAISASVGIGGGVLLLTVLAVILPPAALIPVHGVVQFGSNVGRAGIMHVHIERRLLVGFLAGSVLGVLLGGSIAMSLPSPVVLTGVSLFVLWSVFAPAPKLMRGSAWAAGAISSTLTMFFGATGPLVAAWIKTFNFDRMTHAATQSACLTFQHLLKTIAFGFLGFAFTPWILLILVLVAAGFIGTLIGKNILMRTSDRRFKRLLDIVLVMLALHLLWRGISGIYQSS